MPKMEIGIQTEDGRDTGMKMLIMTNHVAMYRITEESLKLVLKTYSMVISRNLYLETEDLSSVMVMTPVWSCMKIIQDSVVDYIVICIPTILSGDWVKYPYPISTWHVR